MRRLIALSFCITTATGCVDAQRMEKASFEREFEVSGGYQSVFAHTNRQFISCLGGVNTSANLYPDLGYAEIIYSSSVLGDQVRMRISPAGGRTKVELKMSHIGGKGSLARRFEAWTRGSNNCRVSVIRD